MFFRLSADARTERPETAPLPGLTVSDVRPQRFHCLAARAFEIRSLCQKVGTATPSIAPLFMNLTQGADGETLQEITHRSDCPALLLRTETRKSICG